MKPIVKIEDWCIFGKQLHGKVYNHPRFDDGHSVFTSRIESFSEDLVFCITLNTIYELGQPSDESERQKANELSKALNKSLKSP